jgi:hypothetical protein
MARSNPYGIGGLGFSADAVITHVGRFTMLVDGTRTGRLLVTEGMPYISVWAGQILPVAAGTGATLTLEFAVRPQSDMGDYQWFPFGSVVLVPNVPAIVFAIDFPASVVRVKGARVPGFDTIVDYVLGAHA